MKTCDNGDAPYLEFEKLGWVADKPIPKVGSELNVKINGIGHSVVQKYFVQHGFIGMIVKPTDPPPWYLEQNGKGSLCHVFPAECSELEVRMKDGEVDDDFYLNECSLEELEEKNPIDENEITNETLDNPFEHLQNS